MAEPYIYRYALLDIQRCLIEHGSSAALTGNEQYSHEPIQHYLYDTRLNLDPANSVFIALSGATRDGHSYIPQAIELGIRKFIVSKDYAIPNNTPAAYLVVDDVLKALQVLAAYHRQRFTIPIIGITGSNGKTVVKEWLATLLDGYYEVHKSPRSFNSQIGVALSLLALQPHHTIAIIEAGISERGEMARLARMIAPTLGIFTHFGDAHREGFASKDEKLQEKKLLFTHAQKVLLTADDPFVHQSPWQVAIRTIGQNESADLQVHSVLNTDEGWAFELILQGKVYPFQIPVKGIGALENALLALMAAIELGVPLIELQKRLADLQPVDMRTEFINDNREITIINDAYNADEHSALNAFALLEATHTHPKRIVILTDLEHQGAAAESVQRRLLTTAIEHFGAENIWLVGPLFCAIAQGSTLRAYVHVESLLQAFHYPDFQHATVLLKGARRFRLERLVPYLGRLVGATYLKINLNAIKHNLEVFRSKLPRNTLLMVMLKAASYGSGRQLGAELAREGVDYFGVASTWEGMELRRMGVKTPIMVLNADENALGLLWDFNLEPAVWSFRLAERLAQEAIRRNSVAAPTPQSALKVHVEFDTGMGRLGFAPDALPAILAYFEQNPCLVPVGVFTHLAAAEDPLADAFTDTQISRFTQVAAELKAHYPTILRHVLNTGGAQRFGFSGFEMVRLGIGIYGLSPVPELQAQLQETASLHTTISQIHNYPAGTTVGYGRAGVLMRDSRIATLPLGYADGIPRRLGEGKIHLLLHGQKCPVVGRICMDMLMIDITDVPQGREGDEVVVFGQQGDARQSLLTLAEAAEAIPYELLTALPDRIRRVYVRE